MTGNSLFDFATPIAHEADPSASHEAAARVTRSGARAAHSKIVLELVTAHPGKTSGELAALTDKVDLTELRRRLTDLYAKARIYRGGERACARLGTKQTYWFHTGYVPRPAA